MYELSLLHQLRLLTDPPIDPPVDFQNELLARIQQQFLSTEGNSQSPRGLWFESATVPPTILMGPITDQVEPR